MDVYIYTGIAHRAEIKENCHHFKTMSRVFTWTLNSKLDIFTLLLLHQEWTEDILPNGQKEKTGQIFLLVMRYTTL